MYTDGISTCFIIAYIGYECKIHWTEDTTELVIWAQQSQSTRTYIIMFMCGFRVVGKICTRSNCTDPLRFDPYSLLPKIKPIDSATNMLQSGYEYYYTHIDAKFYVNFEYLPIAVAYMT